MLSRRLEQAFAPLREGRLALSLDEARPFEDAYFALSARVQSEQSVDGRRALRREIERFRVRVLAAAPPSRAP